VDSAIREGRVDPSRGELARHARHVAGRRAHDHGHVGSIGRHVLERVHVEDVLRQRADLVGRERPYADPQQQHQLGRDRGQA
jgi:hypothetical protein